MDKPSAEPGATAEMGGRTRTRKCRLKKFYLKWRPNPLGIRNIFVPETFRGGFRDAMQGVCSRWFIQTGGGNDTCHYSREERSSP